MKILLLSAALLIPSLFLFSCKKEESNPIPPPEEQPQVNLTLEDTSCTEAWIKLSTGSLALPSDIDLYRDSSLVETINLTSEDTVLYVDSLLPNHTYKYQSVIQSTGQSGNLLSVTTMDTTSHNFSFQSWTFGGQAGSCVLNDVAIIDEDNIWAVGEIYLLDTLGQPDPDRYNLAVWNGNNWEIKRVPYYYQGQPFYHPIRSVFAFGANDIWFCGNGLIHWDGNQYNPVAVPNWGPYWMNEIWGTSDNDLYVVGDNGHIAHYQNGIWSRIESGTTLNIYDIWGDYDDYSSEYEINMVAAHHFEGPERKILTLKNNSISELSTANIADGSLDGIWFESNRKYFVVGNGIYSKQKILSPTDWDTSLKSLTPFYSYAIRASSLNNIFICGSFGDVLHYNGFNWKTFRNTPGFYDAEFYNIDVKKGVVSIVGQRNNSGFLVIGKTQ